jgi:signal transduction histidine kinase
MLTPYQNALKGLLVFSAYLLTAKLGLSLAAVSGFATLVWFPTGLSFAALFIWGRAFWPAIALGALAANMMTGAPFTIAVMIAAGNTLEAVVGVHLFRKFSGADSNLERVRDVGAFVFFGALLSTMISATIGVGGLYITNIVTNVTLLQTWLAWWIGDVLSNLVVAPFFIIWFRNSKRSYEPGRLIEGLILGSLVMVLCFCIFGNWPSPDLHLYLRPHWIFLLLIWATLRFGQKANVTFTLVLSGIAITGTILGTGPYTSDSMSGNLLLLQLFVGAVALSGLFFGALGREKEHALRMRTDFISIASHELRTPLTGINLSLNVLKEYQKENPSIEISNAIQALDRQTNKLTSLVDSLLNVAQIENGNLILEKKETDVSTLVREVSLGFGDLFERTSCSLNLDIQPTVKSVCSSYGIEQVLTNLMMNSMKYGAGKDVKITLASKGNRIRLSVIDEGRGISAEYHEKIFERYQRVDKMIVTAWASDFISVSLSSMPTRAPSP